MWCSAGTTSSTSFMCVCVCVCVLLAVALGIASPGAADESLFKVRLAVLSMHLVFVCADISFF